MKKSLRAAYESARIDPKADVYFSRVLWQEAQKRRLSLSKTHEFDLTDQMVALYTLADLEKQKIAHRISEPYGPIVVFVPGEKRSGKLTHTFRELLSIHELH
jgi:hypothetical protein